MMDWLTLEQFIGLSANVCTVLIVVTAVARYSSAAIHRQDLIKIKVDTLNDGMRDLKDSILSHHTDTRTNLETLGKRIDAIRADLNDMGLRLRVAETEIHQLEKETTK